MGWIGCNQSAVAEMVAGNVRAFRQLRGIDQAVLARRMESLGIGWRQVTVSEVERGPATSQSPNCWPSRSH